MGYIAGAIIVMAVIAVFTMANLSGRRVRRGLGPDISPLVIDPETGQPVPGQYGSRHGQPGGGHHGGQHGGGHQGGGFFGGGHQGGGFDGGGGHHG